MSDEEEDVDSTEESVDVDIPQDMICSEEIADDDDGDVDNDEVDVKRHSDICSMNKPYASSTK